MNAARANQQAAHQFGAWILLPELYTPANVQPPPAVSVPPECRAIEVSFEKLPGVSRLFLDYLYAFPRVATFYGSSWRPAHRSLRCPR